MFFSAHYERRKRAPLRHSNHFRIPHETLENNYELTYANHTSKCIAEQKICAQLICMSEKKIATSHTVCRLKCSSTEFSEDEIPVSA